MSVELFSGSINGQHFVAAHAKDELDQEHFAFRVDMLTSRNGTHMPNFTQTGWLARPIDSRVTPPQLEAVLGVDGENVTLTEVGEVRLDIAQNFLGINATKQAFGNSV